jgi:hypothetical protein
MIIKAWIAGDHQQYRRNSTSEVQQWCAAGQIMRKLPGLLPLGLSCNRFLVM